MYYQGYYKLKWVGKDGRTGDKITIGPNVDLFGLDRFKSLGTQVFKYRFVKIFSMY